METDCWKIAKDLCRCCHAEGSFKNLAEPCSDMGEEEIYCDMLRDSFDIDLTPVPGNLCAPTYTICEPCILLLREATIFKKQVQKCEKKFRDMHNRNMIQAASPCLPVNVKVEPGNEDDSMSLYGDDISDEDIGISCNDDNADDDDDDDCDDSKDNDDEEFNWPTEQDQDLKPKKKIKSEIKKSSRKKDSVKRKMSIKTRKSSKNKGRTKKEKNVEDGDSSAEKEEKAAKRKKAARQRAQKFYAPATDYAQEGDTYICKKCDKRYSQWKTLQLHIKVIHYSIPRYVCPYCNRAFNTQAPLTVHKLEEHNVDERFYCNACKSVFNTKIQLRKHMDNFHMMGLKHKCDGCDFESYSFEAMYKHKFKHKTVKDYHCRFCKKSFLRKSTMQLHERIHTGDRRKVCPVCGQAFVQKASLNYHMTKRHPEVNY